MGLLNTVDPAHERISSCRSEISKDTRMSLLIKEFFQKRKSSRIVLLLVVFLGTGMVIGDGILTPTMSGMISIMISLAFLTDPFSIQLGSIFLFMVPSAVIDVGLANGTLLYMLAVLSAVYGIKVKVPELHEGKSNHIKHLYFL